MNTHIYHQRRQNALKGVFTTRIPQEPNNCDYCTHSHTATAFAKGMTAGQYQELISVVGMAHQTNAIANGLKVPVDEVYLK